ncbi:efflux RND transporter periplasmic adaptor subunit [Edaphocola aurantiacus]|uniref:efflux RND transporter periplasmic adaptor subunit n=1 Tax=Edaphocola aurantiacus TaxID=2601682 RepID=UPI001C93DAE4|nr:efflux RND transporter periplasmic adaptor subunit [Edaphocola aurantiacus]
MNKRIILPVLILIAVAVAIGWKLSSNKKKIDDKNKPEVKAEVAIPVTVATVAKEMVTDALTKTGNLIPNREADIMAVSGGKLVSVNFNLGSYVSQGGTVAQVDSRQQTINLRQAELTKAKADKDFTRYKNLLEGEAATEVNYQDAKYQRDNATTQIELLNKQIADNSIKAPISGQVVSKLKEPGEYVSAGTPLGHIVDISQLKVNVMVSENDAYGLKIGDKVTITTDIYSGQTFSGTITFISNQGDATHNYPVEILLQNNRSYPLKSGTTVNVNFNKKGSGYMMLIPRTALTQGLKTPKVYVIENNKAVLKDVLIGREIGNQVEVMSGLDEGAQVIVSGQINIKNGSLVKAVK